jgi:acetyl esterase
MPAYHSLPVADARILAKAPYLKQLGSPPVHDVQDIRIPGPNRELTVRIYRAGESERPVPVILFFHGSGFVMLDLDSHDGLCRRLCLGSGCVVVSVDYRLAPEHRFPAAPDDCLAAALWTVEHIGAFGGDGSRMVLSGDSAGGCLAVVTAMRLRDQGRPLPRGQLLFYPVLDAPPSEPGGSYESFGSGYGLSHEGMRWFWEQYVPDPAQQLHPHAAPLRMKSVRGLPPAHLEVAEFDVLRDEAVAYSARLRDEGVPVTTHIVEGFNHGFLKYAGELREVDEVVGRSCAWVNEVCGNDRVPSERAPR